MVKWRLARRLGTAPNAEGSRRVQVYALSLKGGAFGPMLEHAHSHHGTLRTHAKRKALTKLIGG